MNRMKIKAIAGVLVVFLLGTFTGALGTGIFIRHKLRQFSTGEHSFRTFFMKRLERELNLTDEQKPHVQKIFEDSEQEIRTFLRNSRSEFDALMQERIAQLKEVLTPEQQQQFDAMHSKIKERWHIESPHPK